MARTTLALLACLAAAGSGRTDDLPLPVAARTERVVVRTDLGEAWARETAAGIETERAALVEELGPLLGRRASPRPLTVLAFRSSAAYRAYAAKASPPHVLELGWYDPERVLAVVHTATRFPARHEAAHWVLREVLGLPGRDDLPVWVVEGIPCLAEAAPAFRTRQLADVLEKGADPAIGLVATAGDLGHGRDPVLYATAWAVAEWLRSERPDTYRAYLRGIRADGELPDLAKLAGTDLDALAGALRSRARERARDPERERVAALYPDLVPDPDRPASPAEVARQVEFLRHPDLETQRRAMRWFANHRHPDVVPALTAALPGESERFRVDACKALARTNEGKAVALPWLVGLLEAEAADLRLSAARTLRRLTRQDFGFRPHDAPEARSAAVARWRAWLEERGAAGD